MVSHVKRSLSKIGNHCQYIIHVVQRFCPKVQYQREDPRSLHGCLTFSPRTWRPRLCSWRPPRPVVEHERISAATCLWGRVKGEESVKGVQRVEGGGMKGEQDERKIRPTKRQKRSMKKRFGPNKTQPSPPPINTNHQHFQSTPPITNQHQLPTNPTKPTNTTNHQPTQQNQHYQSPTTPLHDTYWRATPDACRP